MLLNLIRLSLISATSSKYSFSVSNSHLESTVFCAKSLVPTYIAIFVDSRMIEFQGNGIRAIFSFLIFLRHNKFLFGCFPIIISPIYKEIKPITSNHLQPAGSLNFLPLGRKAGAFVKDFNCPATLGRTRRAIYEYKITELYPACGQCSVAGDEERRELGGFFKHRFPALPLLFPRPADDSRPAPKGYRLCRVQSLECADEQAYPPRL